MSLIFLGVRVGFETNTWRTKAVIDEELMSVPSRGMACRVPSGIETLPAHWLCSKIWILNQAGDSRMFWWVMLYPALSRNVGQIFVRELSPTSLKFDALQSNKNTLTHRSLSCNHRMLNREWE
jgi:hypothetical protein